MPRMQTLQPIITKESAEAYFAPALDWLGWLLALIARLGAPFRSRRLTRLVAQWEHGVEAMIFLRAVARLGFLGGRRPRAFPLSAPGGFRRARVNPRRRLLFKRARIRLRRAGPYQRVLRLIAVLANPEPYVARFVARLRNRGLRRSAIMLVAPPAWALACGDPPAPMLCDDS
jgi:hypothetical protein